jgi:hypothetical protein
MAFMRSQSKEPRVLERPFHLITVVWGEHYTKCFLDYCVASLLAPGNLPALSTAVRSKFLIATLPENWEYMNTTPIFQRLRDYIDPVFIEIPPCPKGKSGCEHMGVGHKSACELSYREKAYAMIFTPDSLISDGTIANLQRHARAGTELVWVPALRFAEESFLGHLRAWELLPSESPRETGSAVIITGAELVRAAINGMHSETLSYEWEANYFPSLPSAVWWKVPGETGMLVYCLSWAPFLFDFAAVKSHDTTALETWTIDGNYAYLNLGSAPKIHIVQDSDEMFYASWGPLKDRPYPLTPRFTNRFGTINFLWKAEELRAAFRGPVFDPLKRQYFFSPARWHADPINARWRDVERKSMRTLTMILRPRLGFTTIGVGMMQIGMGMMHLVLGMLLIWRRVSLIVTASLEHRDTIASRLANIGDPNVRRRIWWRIRHIAAYLVLGRSIPEHSKAGST